jgi:hypothetical protein
MAKVDNSRRFPGESGPRPDHAAFKRKEAVERQTEYNKLSPADKLARLDAMFGPGKGGTNERAKLNALIMSKNVCTPSTDVVVEEDAGSKSPEKPRVKAKERRKKESKQ